LPETAVLEAGRPPLTPGVCWGGTRLRRKRRSLVAVGKNGGPGTYIDPPFHPGAARRGGLAFKNTGLMGRLSSELLGGGRGGKTQKANAWL